MATHPSRETNEVPLNGLGVTAALDLMRSGAVSSLALVTACITRIAARDPLVQAWQNRLSTQVATDLARAHDEHRSGGAPCGPLCGLPVAVKDVIDTEDLPTEYGSPLYRAHRPDRDAACVTKLRAAGAIILGKTVTCEFANYPPSRTANPLDLTRTPGGSSSGSAAAVADQHVAMALGTQTAGSIIRPAAFTGVIGFKASFDAYARAGVLPLAPSIDTLGFFVRQIDDLRPIHRVMSGRVPQEAFAPGPNRTPKIGITRTPWWERGDPYMRGWFEQFVVELRSSGADCVEIELPAEFTELLAAHEAIFCGEAARQFATQWREHPELLDRQMVQKLLIPGAAVSDERLDWAIRTAATWRSRLSRLTSEVDVLLTPAAVGEAPSGLHSTGDPIFNRVWTALHVPCLSLPVGVGPHGMPLAVQLIGHFGQDDALIDAAGWMASRSPYALQSRVVCMSGV